MGWQGELERSLPKGRWCFAFKDHSSFLCAPSRPLSGFLIFQLVARLLGTALGTILYPLKCNQSLPLLFPSEFILFSKFEIEKGPM